MAYMDLISLISLLLSVASFFASAFNKFKSHRREFMAIGYVLFGFVTSRILFIFLPSGNLDTAIEPRNIVIMIILMVMAIIILVALKKEGSEQAIWVVFMFIVYVSIYGKSLGIIDNFKLRDNEILAIVEISEKSGDMDRAIDLLEWMKEDHNNDEKQVIDARIDVLKSNKIKKLSNKP
jgi:hypothetical protein